MEYFSIIMVVYFSIIIYTRGLRTLLWLIAFSRGVRTLQRLIAFSRGVRTLQRLIAFSRGLRTLQRLIAFSGKVWVIIASRNYLLLLNWKNLEGGAL